MQNNPTDDSKSLNADDQTTLSGAGVDLAGGSDENIAEGEKEEVEVMDIDSTTGAATDVPAGIKFVEQVPVPDKTDLSALAEAKAHTQPSSDDLEAEFNSELHDMKGPLKSPESVVMNKPSTLAALLQKIGTKLSSKKTSVKEELGSLKKMKDAIGHDIEEIKQLEDSERKIKDEISKIESIKKEVEEIEETLGSDLK